MKLITEMIEGSDVECLVENTQQGKKYYVEGRWASTEPNKNGRIYPSSVLESALNKYNIDYIQPKRALGELGHPSGPGINLDRASHIIENLKFDGKHVTGRAKIMETPMGIIARNLIDEGVKLGVSTRGLGSLKPVNGIQEVQSDFFMSAIDLVSDPSGKDCWVNGLQENIEYQMLEDGRIIQLAVDTAKKRIDESKAIKLFSNLLEEFKNG